MKAKINTCSLIKPKAFAHITTSAHETTINKTKRLPTEWEKIFANDMSKKGVNNQNIQRTHTIQYQKKKKKETTTQ